MAAYNRNLLRAETAQRCFFCDARLTIIFNDRDTGEEHFLCPGCRFYTTKNNITENNYEQLKETTKSHEHNKYRLWG